MLWRRGSVAWSIFTTGPTEGVPVGRQPRDFADQLESRRSSMAHRRPKPRMRDRRLVGRIGLPATGPGEVADIDAAGKWKHVRVR